MPTMYVKLTLFVLFSFVSLNFVVGFLSTNAASSSPKSTTWNPPQYWNVDNFPNPRYDVTKCGRGGKTSYVCDPNNVLSTFDADLIDAAIDTARRDTPCECGSCPSGRGGFIFAVAIVPWLEVPPGAPRSDYELQLTIEHFAKTLNENKWNYGYCRNDAVIVLSKYDRKLFTSTGKMTNDYLPSYCVDQASNDEKGNLKRGKYANAITNMIHRFEQIINDDGVCSYGIATWVIAVAVVVPIVIIVGLSIFCRAFCVRGRTGGGGTGNGFMYGWIAGNNHHHHHHGNHHHGHHHSGGGSSWGGGGGYSSGGGGGGGGTSW